MVKRKFHAFSSPIQPGRDLREEIVGATPTDGNWATGGSSPASAGQKSDDRLLGHRASDDRLFGHIELLTYRGPASSSLQGNIQLKKLLNIGKVSKKKVGKKCGL